MQYVPEQSLHFLHHAVELGLQTVGIAGGYEVIFDELLQMLQMPAEVDYAVLLVQLNHGLRIHVGELRRIRVEFRSTLVHTFGYACIGFRTSSRKFTLLRGNSHFFAEIHTKISPQLADMYSKGVVQLHEKHGVRHLRKLITPCFSCS